MCVVFRDIPIFNQEMDGYFLFHSLWRLIYFYKLEKWSACYGLRMWCPAFGESTHPIVCSSVSSEEKHCPLKLSGTLHTLHNAEVKILKDLWPGHISRQDLNQKLANVFQTFYGEKATWWGRPEGILRDFSHLASSPRSGLCTNWYLQVIISSVLKRFL